MTNPRKSVEDLGDFTQSFSIYLVWLYSLFLCTSRTHARAYTHQTQTQSFIHIYTHADYIYAQGLSKCGSVLLHTHTHTDQSHEQHYKISLQTSIHDVTEWGECGFNCWGVRVPCLSYSCLTLMYLECACGFACPPSLWQYWLPGFSSTSGGLSLWFHPGWLTPIS